jgi:4-amino-4-deoxy-L-arabinose transferase-like glycosyltransferase
LTPEANVVEQKLPRPVWLTAGGVVGLLLSMAGRYGFHRDELYFLVAGRRLDWGFVDQPPLTPLIARISETICGTSSVSLRVLPALAIGGVVILTALMARQFGGGFRAQIYAAIAAGGSGIALAVGHLLSTAAFDYLLWTLATWILVQLLDGAEPRWWLGLGLTVGVGLQNKHLIGLFAAAVLIALLATPRRKLLVGPWPWIGVGLAAVLALPNIAWQLANDLPQLEMARALADRGDGPVAFVLEQIGLLSIVLAVPAGAGLWRLLRVPAFKRWRPIGTSFLLLFGFFLVAGGKSYYLAPMYPVLLAAGAIWFEGLQGLSRRMMIGASVWVRPSIDNALVGALS